MSRYQPDRSRNLFATNCLPDPTSAISTIQREHAILQAELPDHKFIRGTFNSRDEPQAEDIFCTFMTELDRTPCDQGMEPTRDRIVQKWTQMLIQRDGMLPLLAKMQAKDYVYPMWARVEVLHSLPCKMQARSGIGRLIAKRISDGMRMDSGFLRKLTTLARAAKWELELSRDNERMRYPACKALWKNWLVKNEQAAVLGGPRGILSPSKPGTQGMDDGHSSPEISESGDEFAMMGVSEVGIEDLID